MESRARAFAHFKQVDKRFHRAVAPHMPRLPLELPNLRGKDRLFNSLCSIVISQQLGSAAADTIYERVRKACGGKLTPASVARVKPAALRAAGLSGAKAKTLKAIAKAVTAGTLDIGTLRSVPEEAAKSRLTEIWGIGPWSAEMFLIFALGRHDVFSPGDLGLARAIETIYRLPRNTPREKLLLIAERWAPYRSWASLLLWRTRDVKLPATPLPPSRKKSKGRHR